MVTLSAIGSGAHARAAARRSAAGAAAESGPAHHRESGERLAGAVTVLAALAALAIAVALPATYFLSANNRISGIIDVRAKTYGDQVSDAASQDPELWNAFFSDARIDLSGLAIAAADDDALVDHAVERRRVFSAKGHLLLDVAPLAPLEWPVFSARAPVTQTGNHLGDVELTRSLRPVLVSTAIIASGSFGLGALLLTVLRVVPPRLMREALNRAAYLSAHDQLTGLPNRRLVADRLEQALAASRRNGGKVAMHCLDLDHFKRVNDTLGHAAGDALLRTIAARLRGCLRESDTLARLGGGEFAVIQPDVHQESDAEVLAARLIEVVREPVPLEGQQVFVGLSIGIALSTPDVDQGELTKQADVALYEAKGAGRAAYRVFAAEMNAGLQRRRVIEGDLRGALDRGELTLVYQPQVEVASGRIVGAEALMRWSRRGHGPVSPEFFIPIAEETGLMVPMGVWLLGEACREAARWPGDIRVAVNVSPMQFRSAGFLGAVCAALAASGLAAHRL
jgi:diguanylate cyclase (GGDEF)-like protein